MIGIIIYYTRAVGCTPLLYARTGSRYVDKPFDSTLKKTVKMVVGARKISYGRKIRIYVRIGVTAVKFVAPSFLTLDTAYGLPV
jgi:hypothetical protein